MNKSVETQPVVLRLQGLKHELIDREKNESFTVFVEQDLEFRSRDFIGVLGPSGCGKTTLLTILGLLRLPNNLDRLEHFELFVPQRNTNDLKLIDLKEAWKQRRRKLIERVRREHMGFALQSGELVSSLTVTENIQVPLLLNGWPRTRLNARCQELLGQFRLNRIQGETSEAVSTDGQSSGSKESDASWRAKRNVLAVSRINRLSGGEYQRVVLARAISHRPSVVFIDEPTSALNRELANDALTVMQDLQRDNPQPGITFMITHDEELAEKFCSVIVRMAAKKNEPAGEVVEVIRKETSLPNSQSAEEDVRS